MFGQSKKLQDFNNYSQLLGIDLNKYPYKQALGYYYILYSLIIKILLSVYGGYKKKFVFVPPEEELIKIYQTLMYDYKILDKRPDIDVLRLYQFHFFSDISDIDFVSKINMWQISKDNFLKDKVVLKSLAGNSQSSIFSQLADNVQVLLEEHTKQKRAVLSQYSPDISTLLIWKNLVIDTNKATLKYKDSKPLKIQLDTYEIRFLLFLLSKNGKIARYKELADYFGRADSNRDIQYIKRDLGNKLQNLGLSKVYVDEIKALIQAQKNIGYQLI